MNMDKKIAVRCRGVILHDEKLFLVTHPHDLRRAVLPGGHLEWGEDVKMCLQRELIEELGVKPEIGKLLYVNSFQNDNNVHSIEFFFEVKNGSDYLSINSELRSHQYEIDKIIWADKTTDLKILPLSVGEDFKAGRIISNETRFL